MPQLLFAKQFATNARSTGKPDRTDRVGNLSRLALRVAPSGRPHILNKREYSFSVLLGLVTLASVLPLLLLGMVGLSAYVAEEQADQLNRLNRYNETLASAVDRRSEEHTSELQSRENLVCRLLLEKKNRT